MRCAPCAASGPPSGRGSGTWGTKEEEEEEEAKVFTTNGFHEGLPSEHTVQDGRYMIYTAPL